MWGPAGKWLPWLGVRVPPTWPASRAGPGQEEGAHIFILSEPCFGIAKNAISRDI